MLVEIRPSSIRSRSQEKIMAMGVLNLIIIKKKNTFFIKTILSFNVFDS